MECVAVHLEFKLRELRVRVSLRGSMVYKRGAQQKKGLDLAFCGKGHDVFALFAKRSVGSSRPDQIHFEDALK